MDIPAHHTLRIWILMEAKQLPILNALHSLIDVQQRDLPDVPGEGRPRRCTVIKPAALNCWSSRRMITGLTLTLNANRSLVIFILFSYVPMQENICSAIENLLEICIAPTTLSPCRHLAYFYHYSERETQCQAANRASINRVSRRERRDQRISPNRWTRSPQWRSPA